MTFVAYLLKRFFPLFLGAVAFFGMVILLVDLLVNLWKYISDQVPLASVLKVLLYYVPKTVSFAVPLSILFASSYTLSTLYAQNELLAIFSSGTPLFKFAAPLLALSLLMSLGMFCFDDALVVPWYAKKLALQDSLIGEVQSLDLDKPVIISERGNVIYKADRYDEATQSLLNLFVVIRGEDKALRAIIRADSAEWRDGAWVFSEAAQYTAEGEAIRTGEVEDSVRARLTEPPATFRNNTVSVESVPVREAKEYVGRLSRAGLPSAEARSQYYKKFSFPLIVFIVVFLSIGLSGKTRKNVLIVSLVLCLFAGVLFYVAQMVTMLLAKFGMIPPLTGAWLPVWAFTVLSAVLLRYSKT
jgi:lipopolysaccharide export system permease protein